MSTRLETLRKAASLSDVAILLGMSPKGLAYTIRVQPLASRYSTFTIPKKSGGVRTINAPEPGLKLVQGRLAAFLQDCISDINEEREIAEKLSHGFRRGRSIVTNAEQHCNRNHVFNVDIEEFFPSINLGRVRGFFLKNRHFMLQEPVANVLAQIACYNNQLPQGSPSSPVISNLIAHVLDVRLAGVAHQYGCHYTRYADDLTFSTNLKVFPPKIGRLDLPSGKWVAGSRLRREIKDAGFSINAGKTRLQLDQSRQDVTGIVVNKGVNVRAEYYKSARAKCHQLFKTGKFFELVKKELPSGEKEFAKEDGNIKRLDGTLSFIDFIKDARRKAIILGKPETGDKVPKGFHLLYKKFLFYYYFFSCASPVIICEGKTDNTYIRLAAYFLHSKLPVLVDVSQQKPKLKVKLFNYSNKTQRLLSLGGGTGQLSSFISQYKKNVAGFSASGERHPTIIVVDNDDGSKPIYGALKGILNKTISGNDPFYYVGENLYVVPTPKASNGDDTMIESFLPPHWLSFKLNGKSFNPDNTKLDTKTQIGKSLFSEHVIKKNRASVDFSGFETLLKNIEAAINDYYAMIAIK